MQRKDKRAKKNESHSLRTYSFLATLVLLSVIIGGSYYSSLPKVEHIPSNLQFELANWMTFVPQTAQYVAFVDYQQAYSTSGNTFLFGTSPLIRYYQLPVTIPPQSVIYDLDIQVPQQVGTGAVTVSVVKLRNDTLHIILYALAKTNLPKTEYDGYPVYNLLAVDETSSPQKLISTYTAIIGDGLILSIDQNYGKYAVETILDQYTSQAPTLFDNSDVRRGVYASGAASGPYIGLFVGTFSSQFNNTRMIIKSVIPNGNGITVTRSVLFPSSDVAMSEFGHAHNVYRDADSYRILDQWLVISYNYTIDKLRGEITGI
ncbi:MAG: hypothetical protein ABSA92_04775 [Candidatus Bathyarchaeia archaeon]